MLLLTKLPGMFQLVGTYLLELLLQKHVVLLSYRLFILWHITKLLIHMINLLAVRSWLLGLLLGHLLLSFVSLVSDICILNNHVCTHLFLLFNLLLLSHLDWSLFSTKHVPSILLVWALPRACLAISSNKLVLVNEKSLAGWRFTYIAVQTMAVIHTFSMGFTLPLWLWFLFISFLNASNVWTVSNVVYIGPG